MEKLKIDTPQKYKEEYLIQRTQCFKQRISVLCYAIVALFISALALTQILDPAHFTLQKMYPLAVLIVSSFYVLFINSKVRTLPQAKNLALLFTSFPLILFIFGSVYEPLSFSYAQFILSLFFISLLIPWSLRDIGVLIFLHFSAWWIYCFSRDLNAIKIPPTFFGTDPFANGGVYLSIAAVMCLIICREENTRDLKNFLLLKDVEAKSQILKEELDLASFVHRTLIPQSVSTPQADIAVTYLPLSQVGGDYGKFHFLDDHRLIFFISDVTGHGVPAALLVNRLHAEFQTLTRETNEPGILLKKLNDFIQFDFKGTCLYMTAVCGVINFKDSKLIYSNYGHPSQYVYRIRDGEITGLDAQTTMLGIDGSSAKTIFQKEVPYQKGDLIFLFTDGVLEITNEKGEEFGSGRIKTFLAQNHSLPFGQVNQHLLNELTAFKRGDFKDDILILSIKTR